jgi:curli biogenesis system outer membrane secretion channel CsgG
MQALQTRLMIATEGVLPSFGEENFGYLDVTARDVSLVAYSFAKLGFGDRQLFGILGRGKTQIAYAKVNLNIVNTLTSEVVYSSQGAGEYSLSEREVIGFGSTAGYDATLNGKVLDLAIRDAVNNLVSGIESGAWRPAL